MRTLVLCDNRPHPGLVVHQGLESLGDCGFEFDWIDNAGDWSAERMAGYSLVVMSKSNNVSAADQREWVTPEVQQAFLDYARSGHGMLFIHSGTASYREMPVLRGLIGGVFIRHPKQCPVTVEPRAGHPLTVGSAPFTLMDEHYFMTPGRRRGRSLYDYPLRARHQGRRLDAPGGRGARLRALSRA